MATNITAAFVTQWSNEVKQAFQQKKTKLQPCVRNVSGVIGSTHEFHTVGTVVANTKSRDADVTPLNPAQATKVATLVDSYAPIYLDKLDQYKTNADFRREWVMAGASALGRKLDATIIASLIADNTAIPTATGVFTYARLLEALYILNLSDIDPSERVLVITPLQLQEALEIEELTSADFMTLRAVQNGEVNQALGFKWVMSNELILDTGPSPDAWDCYAFAQSAVGLAIGKDITTTIEWSVDKVSYLVNSLMSIGSVVIETAGVVEIKCDV